MTQPKISVIMTVYNGENYLAETLDSVMAQTFSDWEMIIVNNCSTDGTQAILDSYNDPRIRIIYPENHGTFGDGIRLAYGHARGRYIAVQDGDDLSYPTRFAVQIDALDANPKLGLVSGWFALIDQDSVKFGESKPPENYQELIDSFQISNPMAHSTFMYRRAASDQIGGYPIEYAYGPDFGLVIRLIKKGWEVKVLPQMLLKLREHAGQASLVENLSAVRAHDAAHLYMEARQLEGVSPDALRAGCRNIAKRKLQYFFALISEKKWMTGLRQLISAFARHPLYCLVYLGYRLLKIMGISVGNKTPKADNRQKFQGEN